MSVATPPAMTTVALVGRANSGKTCLVMHLTGAPRRPVNFPGSSVECVECRVRWSGRDIRFVDLPGIASLDAVTRDEQEAVGFLRGESERGAADVLCVVLDASKLSVELNLLRSLRGLDRPFVVVLNKIDVAERAGRRIDAASLAADLCVPVVATNAARRVGLDELRRALLDAGPSTPLPDFDPVALAASVTEDVGRTRRSWTDLFDSLLLHPVLGIPVLALIVFGMFQLVFGVAEPFMEWIEAGQEALGAGIRDVTSAGAWQSFLVDGIVNGVGSVLIFLPQIALLIAFVSVLEASGYMARAAYLLDRTLGRFGLSGRSFVPLATSFGCAIPGVMATRIIDDERDRLATMLVAPLMSCSARLPVYVVLIGAFFPAAWAGTVLFGLYLLGIVVAVAVSTIVRRTILRGGQSMLVMELPVYQWPSWIVVGRSVTSACRSFVVTAGTIIFATAVVIWAASYYPRSGEIAARFEAQRSAVTATEPEVAVARIEAIDHAELRAHFEQSYLARAGKAVQPAFAPLGFDWRATVGVLSAFPARELIVPTLGILFSVPDVDAGDHDLGALDEDPGDGLRQKLRNARDADGNRVFNPLVALSIMVFFALCSQCMATLGAIRRETGSWKWPVFTFGYMTALAWVASMLLYQVGSALGYGLGAG